MTSASTRARLLGSRAVAALAGGAMLLSGSIVPAHAEISSTSAGTVTSTRASGAWTVADLAATELSTDMACPVLDAMSGALVVIAEQGSEVPSVATGDVAAASQYTFVQDPMFQMSLNSDGTVAAPSTLENGFLDSAGQAVANMQNAVQPNHTYSIGYVCTQLSDDFTKATINPVGGQAVASWATLTTDSAGNWTIGARQEPFASVSVPRITGTTAVGYTLTAAVAASVPAADATTFQWLRDGAAIPGATTTTYKLVAADQAHKISVAARHTKAGYIDAVRTSTAYTVSGVFANVVAPRISGTAAVGYTLKAVVTVPSPAPSSIRYQWLRNGAAISGATGSSYKLTASDQAKQIRVKVAFLRAGYLTTTPTSAYVVPKGVFANLVAPTIGGTAKVGYTLKAYVTKPTPLPSVIQYQWLRNGYPIKGATASAYKLTSYDRGKQIRVRVTFVRSGYLTASRTSAYRIVG
ncbi:hypothetical protein [Sinomonas halotolerans]|uniref:Ig-like domain-containing protein n=1 Tax=Sinomonas halotolerans TaxID=1644133 RepID=A0ABU9X0E3_9MICC